MTFIDWSDAEEMIGLLIDYVADERAAAEGTSDRDRLLSDLLDDLRALADEPPGAAGEVTARLRAIRESFAHALAHDDVLSHLDDCIDELERIGVQQV